MAASGEREREGEDDGLAALNRAYAAIVNEARAEVAAGREPAVGELEERVRAARSDVLSASTDGAHPAVEKAERRALEQLARITTIYRARSLLAREIEPAAEPPPPARTATSLRSRLRIRPTITGNLDVQRGTEGDRLTLAWEPVPAVAEWEVRFSERPDPRGSYVLLESSILPPGQSTVDVPIGDHLFRVNILGRTRDGRPLRRALISSLTRETWSDRWERRASAS
ncbi:MAG TPA: hypothetical protein VH063_00125 [Gaiellaceae bacterium]|jgi:hypothetical protein|nr:hypothetical protein [Gaiellaceae bacterium]